MRSIGLGLSFLLAVGCGESKKEAETPNPEEQKKNEVVATVGTLALSDLKLTDSIDPTIPSSVLEAKDN